MTRLKRRSRTFLYEQDGLRNIGLAFTMGTAALFEFARLRIDASTRDVDREKVKLGLPQAGSICDTCIRIFALLLSE